MTTHMGHVKHSEHRIVFFVCRKLYCYKKTREYLWVMRLNTVFVLVDLRFLPLNRTILIQHPMFFLFFFPYKRHGSPSSPNPRFQPLLPQPTPYLTSGESPCLALTGDVVVGCLELEHCLILPTSGEVMSRPCRQGCDLHGLVGASLHFRAK